LNAAAPALVAACGCAASPYVYFFATPNVVSDVRFPSGE
jgi:hypothetical protein